MHIFVAFSWGRYLKEQCSATGFFLQVFFTNHLPKKPPKITIGSLQIFSKILWDISKWRWTNGINDTGGKFAAFVNYTVGKFALDINDIGGKFCHWYRWCCWYRWQICRRYQWHQWQIMGTVSDCWDLIVNLKEKIYLYVNSTIHLYKGVQKKLLKLFWLKIFFICHWCQLHRWCTLSCKYLFNFRKNFKLP